MEPRQLGYTDNEGNYVSVNKEEQRDIEKQIEERQRMEEEVVNPQPGSKMEEETPDIIRIDKEKKEEEKSITGNESYDMVLKEIEKKEQLEKRIAEDNKLVPWLYPEVKKSIWRVEKVDGKVPKEDKKFYQQAAVGRAISIKFSYEVSSEMNGIEMKSFEGKTIPGIEFKKEELTKFIKKVGQFNEEETISSKEVSKTVIKILIEYRTSQDKYPVYYLMIIDRWNVRIKKIKEIVDPMVDSNLSDLTFLPDEYKNEPKEFDIKKYKKARVTIEHLPYVQTEEEMQRNYRPRPLVITEQYYKMPDEIQEKKNKWLEKRKELLNDIKTEREKKKKSIKPRKRLSDIKGDLSVIKENKKIIKKYDKELRQLDKELIKIDLTKDDSKLTPEERELAIERRYEKKEEIREKMKEIQKERNNKMKEVRAMSEKEKRINKDIVESIKSENEIEILPKYEMLKVEMKRYKKGSVVGYANINDTVNMTKEQYEDLVNEKEERMKYLKMQESIKDSWTDEDRNLHASITEILNGSKELLNIVRAHKDLSNCSEQETEKLIDILALYGNYIDFTGDPNDDVKKVLEKRKELQKQKKDLEKKYEDAVKAQKYVKRYNAIKEELEQGNDIVEQEGEEYSIMEEDEGNDKNKENRAVQWARQKTDLFTPEMMGYTETDDFYSTNNKLEIKPAGTVITNKKGETKKLENEVINLEININKGEKRSYIGIYVTKDKGYITIRLDSDTNEEFVQMLKNGSIKQVTYSSYLEIAN